MCKICIGPTPGHSITQHGIKTIIFQARNLTSFAMRSTCMHFNICRSGKEASLHSETLTYLELNLLITKSARKLFLNFYCLLCCITNRLFYEKTCLLSSAVNMYSRPYAHKQLILSGTIDKPCKFPSANCACPDQTVHSLVRACTVRIYPKSFFYTMRLKNHGVWSNDYGK